MSGPRTIPGALLPVVALMLAVPAPGEAEAPSGASSPSLQPDTTAAEPEYRDVIPATAETEEGFFDVHRVDDEYYYEIPEEMLGREMVLVTRIARTQSGAGFGGSRETTSTVRWEEHHDRILLRLVGHDNVAADTLPIFDAVQQSNFEPVIHAFDVETEGDNGDSFVVDMTDFLSSDVRLLGVSSGRRESYGIGQMDEERSFIESIRSFPENLEVRRTVTWDASSPPSHGAGNSFSVEMAHSLVLLPEEPMVPREWDERVGYFSIQQNDFGSETQRLDQRRFIQRFRLEPSDPEAYERGELVEPVEPIIWYIDRATPEAWRPYLKQGVEDWQEAFEAAGFENAIQAELAPSLEEDPDFDPADARYPMIRYLASPVQNASGPRFVDPRSGEILGSHVQWHHNVMNLLRNWYFVHTAAANPEARGVEFDDDVMGELIRFVSAHEIGHALGLPHNQKGHSAIPVDSLRTEWVCENGTSTSVMDYARFNYVAQPGDDTCFMPRIGPYDRWSVEWGYTWTGADDPAEERDLLNEWIVENGDDPIYRFGDLSQTDPGSTREALGDDPVRASDYGVENLQRIMENLQDWTYQEGEDYSHLEELYGQVVGQWNQYQSHVTLVVGGVEWNRRAQGQDGRPYERVSAERQRAAVDYMDRQVFTTPEWIIDEDLLYRFEASGITDRVRSGQVSGMNQLLNVDRMKRLVEQEALHGNAAYTLSEMITDVGDAIWREAFEGGATGAFRRNLQRAHLDRLAELLEDEDAAGTDIAPLTRGELHRIRGALEDAGGGAADETTRLHFQDSVVRIDRILDEG